MFCWDWKKIAIFAGGTLFGTAGLKILGSKDARKLYTHCTAAILRGKDCVMKTYDKVSECANDIYEEARQINAEREAEEEACEIEDAAANAGETASANA